MTSPEYWHVISKKGDIPIRRISQISDFTGSSWYDELIVPAIEEEKLPAPASPLSSYLHRDETYQIGYSNEGIKTNFLNRFLPHIFKVITDSKNILELEDDWDDEGANASDLNTYTRAINFVRNYAIKIYQSGIAISAPSIEILRDGSIGVSWESSKASFLIVFDKSDEKISYCYGKNKVNGILFKTGVENDNTVDESVASWMKNNLRG